MSIQDAMRVYLDMLASVDSDELKAYLIKKKVENDPEDTVYHFDNAEDAMNFLDYAAR